MILELSHRKANPAERIAKIMSQEMVKVDAVKIGGIAIRPAKNLF